MKNKIAGCAEQQDEGKEHRRETKGGRTIKKKTRVAKELGCLRREQLWGQSRDITWYEVPEEFRTNYIK